jgi:hypothetical protein
VPARIAASTQEPASLGASRFRTGRSAGGPQACFTRRAALLVPVRDSWGLSVGDGTAVPARVRNRWRRGGGRVPAEGSGAASPSAASGGVPRPGLRCPVSAGSICSASRPQPPRARSDEDHRRARKSPGARGVRAARWITLKCSTGHRHPLLPVWGSPGPAASAAAVAAFPEGDGGSGGDVEGIDPGVHGDLQGQIAAAVPGRTVRLPRCRAAGRALVPGGPHLLHRHRPGRRPARATVNPEPAAPQAGRASRSADPGAPGTQLPMLTRMARRYSGSAHRGLIRTASMPSAAAERNTAPRLVWSTISSSTATRRAPARTSPRVAGRGGSSPPGHAVQVEPGDLLQHRLVADIGRHVGVSPTCRLCRRRGGAGADHRVPLHRGALAAMNRPPPRPSGMSSPERGGSPCSRTWSTTPTSARVPLRGGTGNRRGPDQPAVRRPAVPARHQGEHGKRVPGPLGPADRLARPACGPAGRGVHRTPRWPSGPVGTGAGGGDRRVRAPCPAARHGGRRTVRPGTSRTRSVPADPHACRVDPSMSPLPPPSPSGNAATAAADPPGRRSKPEVAGAGARWNTVRVIDRAARTPRAPGLFLPAVIVIAPWPWAAADGSREQIDAADTGTPQPPAVGTLTGGGDADPAALSAASSPTTAHSGSGPDPPDPVPSPTESPQLSLTQNQQGCRRVKQACRLLLGSRRPERWPRRKPAPVSGRNAGRLQGAVQVPDDEGLRAAGGRTYGRPEHRPGVRPGAAQRGARECSHRQRRQGGTSSPGAAEWPPIRKGAPRSASPRSWWRRPRHRRSRRPSAPAGGLRGVPRQPRAERDGMLHTRISAVSGPELQGVRMTTFELCSMSCSGPPRQPGRIGQRNPHDVDARYSQVGEPPDHHASRFSGPPRFAVGFIAGPRPSPLSITSAWQNPGNYRRYSCEV